MNRVISALVVALFGGTACSGGSAAPGVDTRPLLEHLGNVVAVSALPDTTIDRLDATLQGAMEAADPGLGATLDGIRATTLDALNAMVGPDSLDAVAEWRMRSLLDIMNLTHAIAGATGVQLAVAQTVYKKHRCDRVGSGGRCVSNARYNCSHIGGSCFETRSP